MKKCSTCKKFRLLTDFMKCAKANDGLQWHCRDCHKKARRKSYLKRRDNELAKAKEWRENFRKWWTELKSQFSCIKCGEDHPGCLQFHHLTEDKVADVSTLAWNGKNKKAVLEEIAKCVALCANCHGKLHWEKRNGKYCRKNVGDCDQSSCGPTP